MLGDGKEVTIVKTIVLRHLRGPIVFAAAFAVAGGTVALALTLNGSDPSAVSPVGVRNAMSWFDPAAPLLPDGSQTTIEKAAELAGYPIVRPVATGEPSEVWVADAGEGIYEVGLRYFESGLVVLLAPWPEGKDPIVSFSRSIQDLDLAYTATIAGNPASVLPYDPDTALFPLDVVHVVLDGVEVSIYGVTGLEDVLAAAESLKA
jgi:hypothetical protein